MTDKQDDDHPWVNPFCCKHPALVMQILLDIVEAGLAKGWCFAGDVKIDVPKEKCNSVGVAFSKLKHGNFGFTQTSERRKMTDRKKHNRYVGVWRLENRRQAEQFIAHQRRLLVQVDSTGNEMFNF